MNSVFLGEFGVQVVVLCVCWVCVVVFVVGFVQCLYVAGGGWGGGEV